MNFLGNNREKALLFLGGAVFSVVFTSFCKTKTAKKLCVNAVTKGMLIKDDVENTIAVIKEEAEDMYAEAKQNLSEEECACRVENKTEILGE